MKLLKAGLIVVLLVSLWTFNAVVTDAHEDHDRWHYVIRVYYHHIPEEGHASWQLVDYDEIGPSDADVTVNITFDIVDYGDGNVTVTSTVDHQHN